MSTFYIKYIEEIVQLDKLFIMKFKLSYTVSAVYLYAATEQCGKLHKCYVIGLHSPPRFLCEEADTLVSALHRPGHNVWASWGMI